jgi:NAD(P)H-dependent FMN reductase
MKHIIVGTNRINSRSETIANIINDFYKKNNIESTVIDLKQLDLMAMDGSNYGNNSAKMQAVINDLNHSEGFIIVCPEYNGSYPGALKLFIDHWEYPKTFESRPVAFIGLGGTYGGLRPVEHLQQVFGYRNAYQFPNRLFIHNVWNVLKENTLETDYQNRLENLCLGFHDFCLKVNN